MRHGRAKAARKTLQYFKRTIGLTTPYSVLVDGNFVVMCFQQKVLPIRDRIERVLQISSSPSPSHSFSTFSSSHHNSHQNHHYNKKMLQFWITQDTIDELQMILENLNRQIASSSSPSTSPQEQQHQKSSSHKKNKPINKSEKVAAFEEALRWIEQECQILPKVVSSSTDSTPTTTTTTATSPLPAWTAMVHYIWGNAENEEGEGKRESGGPYIVASQDEELLDILRRGDMGNKTLQEMMTEQQQQSSTYEATAVPILRLANNNSVLLLEQPSKQFQRASQSDERQKWSNRDRVLSEHERELVDLVKQQQKRKNKGGGGSSRNVSAGDHAAAAGYSGGSGSFTTDTTKRRKAGKKAKGPNPLSCKRKQQGDGNDNKKTSENESASKKRRERAKKLQKTS